MRRLPVQLYLGTVEPSEENWRPLANRDAHPKPAGGLWTSTYADGTSEWREWTIAEQFALCETGWLLTPAEARVLTLITAKQIHELIKNYGTGQPHLPEHLRLVRMWSTPSWEAVAADYDVVHMPCPYTERFSMETMWFNSCDVESSLWLRWKFEEVKPWVR